MTSDVPNPPLQPNPAEPAETKLAPAGGQEESGVEQQSSKPSYPDSGGKTYRFQGAAGDLGEVSQVASLKTTRGEVARGGTIELSDEEAEALKGAGFDLAEEGGEK